MNTIVQFVLNHGYAILFYVTFAHQLCLPIPGPLFLIAAGALARIGKLGTVAVWAVAVVSCVLADCVWFEAGRRRGDRVLHFLHRLTSDPDFHDRRSKEVFARFGVALLVVAKFIPGIDAVTPPLAGSCRTSWLRFLVLDAIGAGLYCGVYVGIGYVFHYDLDRAAAYAGRVGTILAGLVLAGLIFYAVRNAAWRRRFIGDLRRGTALMKLGIIEAKRKIALRFASHRPSIDQFPASWKPTEISENENVAR